MAPAHALKQPPGALTIDQRTNEARAREGGRGFFRSSSHGFIVPFH